MVSIIMVISIIIMTRRKARSNAPPTGISHCIQSGVVDWGGGGSGDGGGTDSGGGGGGSVMKALTALQAL